MATSRAFQEVCDALGANHVKAYIESVEKEYGNSEQTIVPELWLLLAYEHGLESRAATNTLLQKLQKHGACHTLVARLFWSARLDDTIGDSSAITDMSEELVRQFDMNPDSAAMILQDAMGKIREECNTPQIVAEIEALYSFEELCYMLRYHYICRLGSGTLKKMVPIIKKVWRSVEEEVKHHIEAHLLAEHGGGAAAVAADGADPADPAAGAFLNGIPVDISPDTLQDPAQAQQLWQSLNEAYNATVPNDLAAEDDVDTDTE